MSLKSQFHILRDNLRFYIFKSIFDYKAQFKQEDFTLDKIEHIVISKLDGKLGDTQVITPFITNLQKNYPQIKITVLCKAHLVSLFKDCLKIENVFVSSKRRMSFSYAKNFCKQINAIGACSLLVTTETVYRPQDFYLAHFLKPKFIAGMLDNLDSLNINMKKLSGDCHISQYFLDLLKLGGMQNIDPHYTELVESESLNKWKSLFKNKKILAISPYGAAQSRYLSDEVLYYLIDKIKQETNYDIAMLFPPNHKDKKDQFEDYIGENRVVHIPDNMSILDLTAIISISQAMISVDTGTLHLACASNLPLLAFYRGDSTTLWGPNPCNKNVIVYHKDVEYMSSIQVNDFKDEIGSFIALIK